MSARIGLDGDAPCADCGAKENMIWFTDNVIWNAVMGENIVHEEARGKIICPPCFVRRAQLVFNPTGWRLIPEFPWRVSNDGE